MRWLINFFSSKNVKRFLKIAFAVIDFLKAFFSKSNLDDVVISAINGAISRELKGKEARDFVFDIVKAKFPDIASSSINAVIEIFYLNYKNRLT